MGEYSHIPSDFDNVSRSQGQALVSFVFDKYVWVSGPIYLVCFPASNLVDFWYLTIELSGLVGFAFHIPWPR